MDLKHIMSNNIRNTKYITKKRLTKFIKQNSYNDKELDVYQNILDVIDTNTNTVALKFQDYEFDKNYKYFSLYEVEYDDLDSVINSANSNINYEEFDYLSKSIEKPTIRRYQNEIDIKFSLIIEDYERDNAIKYPIIATIFTDIKLMSIKFCAVSEKYSEPEFYIEKNNQVKEWIISKLNLTVKDFDSMKVFKYLYHEVRNNPINYSDVKVHSILMDDEMNGRSYFRSSDKDMLPFLDDLSKLSEKFESNNDKKLVLSYISKYENEAIVRNMGITWKNKFSNSRGKFGNITVSVVREYSVNNKLTCEFSLHHIHQNSEINRERINYVIRYISKYNEKNIK